MKQVCSEPTAGMSERGFAVGLLALALLALPGIGQAEPAAESSRVDSLRQAAQGFAAKDDHANAIAMYEAVLQAAPEQRDAVAVPLAAQRTWSGQLDTACAELSAHLERHSADQDARLLYALALSWSDQTESALEEYRTVLQQTPGQRDAALGEARMLAWLGDTGTALERYESLAEQEPDWIEPQLGAAQVLGWRGDHRRAASRYRAVLARSPDHAAAAEGLAQNLRWDGRADLATAVLDDLEREGRATESSRSLARDLDASARPRTAISYEVSEDSDDFNAQTWRWEVEASAHRRGSLRGALARHRFARPRDPTAHETWLETGARYRLATPLEVNAAFAIALERSQASMVVSDPIHRDGSERPWTADLRGSWMPADRTRFELGYARLAFFSYLTFPERIDLDLIGAAVHWRIQPRTTVALHSDWGQFEDENERRSVRATANWVARARGPRLEIGGGLHWLDHDRDPANGVWTPEDYRALFARGMLAYERAGFGSIGAELDGGWARERSAPGATPYLSAAIFASRPLGPFEVRARAGRSDSNVETGRGYRRAFASVALAFRF